VAARIPPETVARALELQRKFLTQEQIASELGVHRKTVERALRSHNTRVLKRLEKHSAAERAKQVAQLEQIACEAFGAWLHSKTPKVVDKSTGNDDGNGAVETTTSREVSSHHCDSSLLNQARGALADIRKILGLEAPEKLNVGMRGLDDAEWAAIADAYGPDALGATGPRRGLPGRSGGESAESGGEAPAPPTEGERGGEGL
jgi:hypothetical protein